MTVVNPNRVSTTQTDAWQEYLTRRRTQQVPSSDSTPSSLNRRQQQQFAGPQTQQQQEQEALLVRQQQMEQQALLQLQQQQQQTLLQQQQQALFQQQEQALLVSQQQSPVQQQQSPLPQQQPLLPVLPQQQSESMPDTGFALIRQLQEIVSKMNPQQAQFAQTVLSEQNVIPCRVKTPIVICARHGKHIRRPCCYRRHAWSTSKNFVNSGFPRTSKAQI